MKRAIVIVTLMVFVSAKLLALVGADMVAANDAASSPVIAQSVAFDHQLSPEAPCCKQHDAAHNHCSMHCLSDCNQTLVSIANVAVDQRDRWSVVYFVEAIALEPTTHFKPPIAS